MRRPSCAPCHFQHLIVAPLATYPIRFICRTAQTVFTGVNGATLLSTGDPATAEDFDVDKENITYCMEATQVCTF
jgi:hypothetical protein